MVTPAERRAIFAAALTDVIPDVVYGVFVFGERELGRVPAKAHSTMAGVLGWSVLVYGVPITDDGLWVWHKHGEYRSLMANYVLARAREAVQRTARELHDEVVSLTELTDNSISMVEAGELAGIGTRGWNNLLLHPEHGSWLQLEALAVASPVEPNNIASYPTDVCIKCMNCINDCPATALNIDDFNASACATLVAAPWNPRSRAVAITSNSYIECRVCITSCPVGQEAEGIFAWRA